MEVNQLIKDYHTRIHDVIVTAVVVDSDYYNVFFNENEPRDTEKFDDGAYYSFDKYLNYRRF